MYTIGDFLIQVKNAYRANKKELTYKRSNAVISLAKILEKEGFVSKVTESEVEGRKMINITLKYESRVPALQDIKLISKPSVHHYSRKINLKKALGRYGVGIISTNQGLMTSKEANKKGVGGELICQIF
jgi:small subunit ribosomal protein S8